MRIATGKIRKTWHSVLIFYLGILLFTFFISRDNIAVLFAIAGLILSAGMVAVRVTSGSDLLQLFGFEKFRKSGWYYLIVSLLAGLIFGMIYRQSLQLWILPRQLVAFSLLACSIGAAEELVFRGFIQTKLRQINVILAVMAAAVAHTAYKLVFFLSNQAGMLIDYPGLIIWTMIGGIAFGIIREKSRNIVFPMVCHMVFDIVVYGDSYIQPWWIWA